MVFEPDFSSDVSIAALFANQPLFKIFEPAAKFDKGCVLYLPCSFIRDVEFLSDCFQVSALFLVYFVARSENNRTNFS